MSRTVNTEGLRDFLDDQRQKISRAFQEIEQIQADYQGAYTRFRADHDRTLQALTDQVEAHADALDANLRQQIDARVPTERQAIAARVGDLNAQLPKLQQEADDLLQRGQKETAYLRTLNPQLNDREESLKADLARGQKQLDDLNAQVSALAKGLGFIFHAGKIHALDRERFRVVGRMEKIAEDLRLVREQWEHHRTLVDKEQVKLKAEWQTTMAKLAQLQQEHDLLAQNAEALARRRASLFVLDNLKTPASAAESALDAQLKQMIGLNIQTDDFQTALGSVAGILGILKGVDEGLRRLRESANALIAEQQRHSAYLPALHIELSDGVLAFGAAWDDLIAKTKDEKTFAAHPTDFSAAMKPFLDERLTNAQITGFFNALGQAIQAATAGWRG